MRLLAIILLLIAMWTFSIGVNNVNNFEPKDDTAAAEGEKFGYAVGSFAIPTVTLIGAWFCWRKSVISTDDKGD